MASACLVQPIAVPAWEHPVFAPVEMVTTAQTQILQTLCAPVSQDCFQLPALFFMFVLSLQSLKMGLFNISCSENNKLLAIKQHFWLRGQCSHILPP